MKGLLMKERILLKTTVRTQALALVIFVLMGILLKNLGYIR